jgi:hypothetical protein
LRDRDRTNQFVACLIVTLAMCLPSSATAQALADNWLVASVGAPTTAGAASVANGTYTVSGTGTDIGGKADQFTFVYRTLAGDGSIVARVTSLKQTHPLAKAGVMMRQSLSAGSPNAFAFVTASKGLGFQQRTRENGSTVARASGVAGAAPVWLKVVRQSSAITASWSVDGIAWTELGSDIVPMKGVVYIGLAVTSRTQGATAPATFTNVQMTPLALSGKPLPNGWKAADVGSPQPSGATAYDQGTFGLIGGGAGIAGSSDQFHFAYMAVQGDVDIVARVAVVGDTTADSKAGIMIRESLAADAAHATMTVTSARGSTFDRRAAAGRTAATTIAAGVQAPIWLKLSIRSTTVTAYRSADGRSWTLAGSDVVAMPFGMYVGLVVASGSPAAAVATNIDNVTIAASSEPTNRPPVVSLSLPVAGIAAVAPAQIVLAAEATDADGLVSRVDFFAGSQWIGASTTAPFTMAWGNVPAGSYSFTAQATDDEGATTRSSPVTMTVTTAPIVTTRLAVFTASIDHATLVNSYVFEVFAANVDARIALPIASKDLGKPPVLSGDCSADVTAMINALPAGTYQATVTAVAGSAKARSAAVAFSR